MEKIDLSELSTEEVNLTSSPLLAGAHHLGNYCKTDFKNYMQKRFEAKDPRVTIEEGKQVTACALDFFRKMKDSCSNEFTEHWKCLEYNQQQFGLCRKTQKPYDECVLAKMGLESDQPVHITGDI